MEAVANATCDNCGFTSFTCAKSEKAAVKALYKLGWIRTGWERAGALIGRHACPECAQGFDAIGDAAE